MHDEKPFELTDVALADLWREIALYLEIRDLVRQEALPRVPRRTSRDEAPATRRSARPQPPCG
jgi:hypothetical protein